MATSGEYIEFVCEQLDGIDGISYRKMFGEYMVYIHGKPVLLVCDNTVMVKKAPELASILSDAPDAIPYEGGKTHYLLNIENRPLVREVIAILEPITPFPQKRAKKMNNLPSPAADSAGDTHISDIMPEMPRVRHWFRCGVFPVTGSRIVHRSA